MKVLKSDSKDLAKTAISQRPDSNMEHILTEVQEMSILIAKTKKGNAVVSK